MLLTVRQAAGGLASGGDTSATSDPNGTAAAAPTGRMLPSIWFGAYADQEAWRVAQPEYGVLAQAADAIDDRLITSTRPFAINAWCAICHAMRPMTVTWRSLTHLPDRGAIRLAGTEVAHCHGCRLYSRVRALLGLLDRIGVPSDACVYAAEQVTATYQALRRRYPNLIGSEYLGPDVPPGATRAWGGAGGTASAAGGALRHEDLTRLSFPAGCFDIVLTLDVFEHVPDYRAAFRECRRVLRRGGHLVFTVPFYPERTDTLIRAHVLPDGTVHHLLPPEIHGNPVASGGALCFQHFGWDLLDELRAAGFSTASGHLYWGPWQGHIGLPGFVFQATA